LDWARYANRVRIKRLHLAILALCLFPLGTTAAQQAATSQPSSTKDGLLLLAPTLQNPLRLTVDELKSMKHVTAQIHNSHTNADETYSGVRLADLLSKAGTPLGDQLRSKALSKYVVASGSDGYTTVLAIAEVDPAFHPGDVLVADAMDGKALDARSGPLKLVVTEDKHPARWVRNLVQIEVKTAP
jgi:DMSO/TMAO reductase YedYZ molybdopterin-dependent catalytic subunit